MLEQSVSSNNTMGMLTTQPLQKLFLWQIPLPDFQMALSQSHMASKGRIYIQDWLWGQI